MLKHWKIGFRLLLSVQLGFSSFPSYSAEEDSPSTDMSENPVIKTGNDLFWNMPSPEYVEQLGEEYDSGTLRVYFDKHPKEAMQFDRFMMLSQMVDLVQYELQTTPEGIVRRPYIKDSVPLNEYREHPSTTMPTDWRVYYPENPNKEHLPELDQGRQFYLEGKQRGDVLFRQYIPELVNVIADTQNQADPEFLVLLDPEKGLFIIDREITPIVAGHAPIPIMNIPLSLSKEQLLNMKEGISVEFVRSIVSTEHLQEQNRPQAEINQYILENTTQPFDIVPQSVNDFLSSQGASFFADGDLAIVYTDSNNQRQLLGYLRRDTLRDAVYQAYGTIDIMITLKSTADLLTDSEKLEDFKSEIALRKTQDRRFVSIDNIYAIVLEDALHKLLPSHSYFQTRRKLLSEKFQSNHFSLENWRRLQLNNLQNEIDPAQERLIRRTFQKLAQIPQWMKGKAQGVVAGTADAGQKLWNGDFKGLGKSFANSWNEHTLRNLLITIFTFGLLAPETFVFLLDMGFTYAENWSHLVGGRPYSQVITYNVIMTGIVMIAIGGALLQLHKPSMMLAAHKSQDYSKKNPFRFLVQWLEKSERYQKIQWQSQHHLDRWRETQKDIRNYEQGRFSRKFIEIGIQLLAICKRLSAETSLPLWNRLARGIARLIGQPLVMDSARRGLNPFTKIRHQFEEEDSTASVRLGWTGRKHLIYSKRRNSLYNEYKKIQDEFIEKSKRTENLAFLLAVLAVYNPHDKDIDFIRSRGAEFFADEISEVLSHRQYKLKHHWVMLYLSREMMKQIDQINLSYGVDVEYEYLKNFYEQAQALAEKYENTSYVTRRLNLRVNRKTLFNMARGALFAFEEKYDFLRASSPILPGERFAMELVPDHITGKVITTGFLGRGSTEMGLLHERDYDSATRWGMSPVGRGDIEQNILAHGLLGGALQVFGLRQDVDTLAEEHNNAIAEIYPLTTSDFDINREQTLGEYLKFQLSYPFRFNGKPDNFGEVVRKRELNQWAMWQVLILTVFLPRLWSGELTLQEALISSLIYNFSALFLYRWPWSAISGGASMNQSILTQNYHRQRDVQLLFLGLSRKEGFTQEDKYREKYLTALRQFVSLYQAPSKDEKLLSFIKKAAEGMLQDSQIAQWVEGRSFLPEDILRVSSQSSMEEIQEVSSRFVDLMVKEPPLPTRRHTGGNWTFTIAAGPILTTLLATNLLIDSWNPENLTINDLLLAFSGWSAFLLLSNVKRKPPINDGVHNGKVLESWVSYFQKQGKAVQEEIRSYRNYRLERRQARQQTPLTIETENVERENSKPSLLARFFKDTSGGVVLSKATQQEGEMDSSLSPPEQTTQGRVKGACKTLISNISSALTR